MNPPAAAKRIEDESQFSGVALSDSFPIVEVSALAERESWRKEINRPIYHIHKWWANRLGSVFRAIVLGALLPKGRGIWESYYETHDFRDKVILDPFMGSGTTLGEALKLGSKVVGCDANPISTFIVKQSLTRVAPEELQAAFKKLEREVAPQIRKYYRTRDPVSGEMLQALYYFWVKEVEAPSGERIPLFDRYVFSQDAYPKKKPRAQVVCPSCWGILEATYDSTLVKCETCAAEFNPQEGPASGQFVRTKNGEKLRIKDLLPQGKPPAHRMYAILAINAEGRKVYLKATAEDMALYADAQARLAKESLPLPSMPVRSGHNTDQARSYNYHFWRDFFNERQLLCLGLLLNEIQKIESLPVREQFLCLFSSTLEFNNLFCSFKGEGTGAVRHMFSNHILKPERVPLENSIWGGGRTSGTFASLFESRLLPAKRYLNDPFEIALQSDLLGTLGASIKTQRNRPIAAKLAGEWSEILEGTANAMVLNGDSSMLPLPDMCIDAVVTDPPYFDYVHYSELSDFFFSWLSPVLRHTYEYFGNGDSSNPGEVQQKDPRRFASQLGRVFREAARVLKTEGVLTFSFHHSRPDGWAAIAEALAIAGLVVVAVHPVHAEMRGASPKTAARDPITLDAILVCRKANVMARTRTDPEAAGDRIQELRQSGLRLSVSDTFVVRAAHELRNIYPEDFDYERVLARFEVVRRSLP